MRYRPEIDGLRAVAVVPVILFHAGFDLFSGGFVGVDVFFVISGYLITGIIHREIKDGSFSIVRFYERRVRRILPALMLVSLACIPFAWLWMLPDEFRNFAQSLVAISVFASNVLFWMESDYFGAAAELKPLLHTWSLAVEEQFYVVFPLFLLVCRKFGAKTLLAVFAGLIVVSLGLAEWASTSYPVADFYLLPTRAWELGIGAVLAVTAPTWSRVDGGLAHVGSALGMAMIVYAVFAFNEAVPFPSLWALIPVLGTALIIIFARPATVVGRVLCWGPIVGIGLISYSAYLWHQPLFAFARIRLLDEVAPDIYLALGAAALCLAYLTWRFVEQPFRRRTSFSRARVFSGAAAVSALVIAVGLLGYATAGLPLRLAPGVVEMAAWSASANPHDTACHASEQNVVMPDEACDYGQGGAGSIVLWGDSHGVELGWQLSVELADDDTSVGHLTHSACVPSPNVYRPTNTRHCLEFSRRVMDHLVALPPTTIVLIARWSMTLEPEPFDNEEGGREDRDYGNVFLPLGQGRDAIDDPNRVAEVGRLYRETIDELLRHGHRIVLVYPVPEVGWDVPNYLAREIQLGVERHRPLSTSYDVYKSRALNAFEQLDLLGDRPNLVRVYPDKIFCDTFLPGRCLAQLDGKPLYRDGHHLGGIGAAMLADRIIGAIRSKGWL